MDDDPGSLRHRFKWGFLYLALMCIALAAWSGLDTHSQSMGIAETVQPAPTFFTEMPPGIIVALLLLIVASAYFSASEVAFFSLHTVRLRNMAESTSFSSKGVAKLMAHPGQLLITILIGNMIVNVLISVLLPTRIEGILEHVYNLPPLAAYTSTVIASTFILVFFGEIMPKVIAVRISETYAKAAVGPMLLVDKLLGPVRLSVLRFTDLLFRVTRFNDINAAPFITDEEFFSVLSDSEAQGVIEEEEGQMIQGILESGDAKLREILVPRLDVIAIENSATVEEALTKFREHEFSRMPVFEGNLDNITGLLFAKDLLTYVFRGDFDHAVAPFIREPNFVPSTMTVQDFVRHAQHKRTHLAIVADEFGGTAGIVTLEDAMEEIVGDIQDVSDEVEETRYVKLSDTEYRVDGGMPLDELSEIIGIELEEGSHETVAGFFIEHTHEIAKEGDQLIHGGLEFTVETIEGKRVLSFHIKRLSPATPEESV